MSCSIFKLVLLCLYLLAKGDCSLTYLPSLAAAPDDMVLCLLTWAAQYNTWLLIKSTPKGVVFPFLSFLSLLAVMAVTVLLLMQGWSQCCERQGPLMSSSWLLSRWAVLHCTAAMLCSIFTHQCSCMSISCATLMHATTVLLISMTKSCHELRPHRASPCMAMAKTYHADKSSGGSC